MSKSKKYVKGLKRGNNDKFFGWREGDGSDPNAKKGTDFMNYGYPNDNRHRKVIKNSIDDKITREELKRVKDYDYGQI